MTLDAVSRLCLDNAGALTGRVLVLDDAQAALTDELLRRGVDVLAYCDDLRDAQALPQQARVDTPDVPGVELAIMRLPKSLGALEDHCQVLTQGPASLRLVAAGRVKHMTRSQNDILGRYFGEVRATLARDKSRALLASQPTGASPRWPRSAVNGRLGLTVFSQGGTFNTFRLDAGTALLLSALKAGGITDAGVRSGRALDVGSGSGILASVLARSGWRVTASDVSAAAVASTALTAQANDLDVETVWRDGLRGAPAGSADLIVTNPPFHRGAARDSSATLSLISDAASVLTPGGELWMVFNSHLPYLAALRRSLGPTTVRAQDRHFTVVRSVAAA